MPTGSEKASVGKLTYVDLRPNGNGSNSGSELQRCKVFDDPLQPNHDYVGERDIPSADFELTYFGDTEYFNPAYVSDR